MWNRPVPHSRVVDKYREGGISHLRSSPLRSKGIPASQQAPKPRVSAAAKLLVFTASATLTEQPQQTRVADAGSPSVVHSFFSEGSYCSAIVNEYTVFNLLFAEPYGFPAP